MTEHLTVTRCAIRACPFGILTRPNPAAWYCPTHEQEYGLDASTLDISSAVPTRDDDDEPREMGS